MIFRQIDCDLDGHEFYQFYHGSVENRLRTASKVVGDWGWNSIIG